MGGRRRRIGSRLPQEGAAYCPSPFLERLVEVDWWAKTSRSGATCTSIRPAGSRQGRRGWVGGPEGCSEPERRPSADFGYCGPGVSKVLALAFPWVVRWLFVPFCSLRAMTGPGDISLSDPSAIVGETGGIQGASLFACF